jgi:hypothetical protein
VICESAHDNRGEPPGGNSHPRPAHAHAVAPPPRRPAAPTALFTWLIGPIFAALGAWFIWLAPAPVNPIEPARAGPPRRFEPQPRLPVLTDPPVIAVGGYFRPCDDCHRLFQTPAQAGVRRQLLAHEHIELAHGLNDRCFNCHDRDHRERLVLRDGATVGFAESSRQCAECHGAAFRDWQRGAHGKTVGSWRADDERRRRLQCVECHDPHAPGYRPLEPLPAPFTLRMGDQSGGGDHGPSRSPLRRGRDVARRHAGDTHDDDHPPAATHEEPAP